MKQTRDEKKLARMEKMEKKVRESIDEMGLMPTLYAFSIGIMIGLTIHAIIHFVFMPFAIIGLLSLFGVSLVFWKGLVAWLGICLVWKIIRLFL